jgi:hypothetical protein
MCVILFKPAGARLPQEETLRKMFKENDDGAGFMLPNGGKVLGRKYKGYKEFLRAVESVPRELPLVVHFRLATHGGRGVEQAQPLPFPIKEKEELFVQKWEAPMGVAHNGVLSGFGDSMYTTGSGTYDGHNVVWDSKNNRHEYWSTKEQKWLPVPGNWTKSDPKEGKLSDTQDCLLWLSKNRETKGAVLRADSAVFVVLQRLLGGRWAFMWPGGKVRLLGEWKQEKGLWFSNFYWKTEKTTVVGSYGVVTESGVIWTRRGQWSGHNFHGFCGDGVEVVGDEKGEDKEADIREESAQKGVCQLPLLCG